MNFDRRLAVAATFVLAGLMTQCESSGPTAPRPTRTRSVSTTVQVPAVPTAPITLATSDAQGQASVTLDVAALAAIVKAQGGPVSIKMTDLASADYGTLAAGEQAMLAQARNLVMATLVFNIARSSTRAGAQSELPVPTNPQLVSQSSGGGQGTLFFKVKNNSGKRCTPGVVDVASITSGAYSPLTSSAAIDDEFPLQNIFGNTQDFADYLVRTWIFDFECPRVTPNPTASPRPTSTPRPSPTPSPTPPSGGSGGSGGIRAPEKPLPPG